MSPEQADAIFTILVKHLGITDDLYDREAFVRLQSSQYCGEYRISGPLGFGGKFRRGVVMPGTPEYDADADEFWYVDYYREDKNAKRDALMNKTNEALRALNLSTVEPRHQCGYDFDPCCDGCVTLRGDAGL